METTVTEQLEAIHARTIGAGENIISVLQQLQENFGYIREDCLHWFARKTGIPPAKFYGVVTFYSQFHLTPRGKNIITVCSGNVCHVRGASKITSRIREQLNLKGEANTTKDLKYTLENVNCVGACSIAPVVTVNSSVHGKQTPDSIIKTINACEGHRKRKIA